MKRFSMTLFVRSIVQTRWARYVFPALLLFLPPASSAQKDREDLFAAYPTDAPSDSAVLSQYRNHSLGRFPADYRDSLLAISLAPTKPLNPTDGLFHVCGITADGLAWRYRDVFEWAIQANHRRQLPAETLEKVKQAIAKLPATQGPCPPRSELAVVSFQQGTEPGAPRRILFLKQDALTHLLELIDVPD